MKIRIDPGHHAKSTNVAHGYNEGIGTLKLSRFLQTALIRCGIEATLTRGDNENPSLTTRGSSAKGYDVFVSEHTNAAGAAEYGQARGVVVFYSVQLPGDKQWAAKISAAESRVMQNTDRGAKTRRSTNSANVDYYGVIRHARAVACPHVFLVESGFHDNKLDVAFLKVDSNLKLLAEAQTKVICEMLGVPYIAVAPSTMKYTVKQGDTLWSIAARFLGNGTRFMEIYNLNKSVIGTNPNIIRVGMVLTIPVKLAMNV